MRNFNHVRSTIDGNNRVMIVSIGSQVMSNGRGEHWIAGPKREGSNSNFLEVPRIRVLVLGV